MYKVVKSVDLDFAHRIDGHETCGNIHGHTWRFEVCLESDELDDMGFVADFKKVKEHLNKFKSLFDHSFLLKELKKDEQNELFKIKRNTLNLIRKIELVDNYSTYNIERYKTKEIGDVTIISSEEPFLYCTCEVLSEFLYLYFVNLKYYNIKWARVYEQLNPAPCYAEYSPDKKG